ncbi:MAG TPA: hypothetical protein VFK43_11275, partial [Acidimicrobiales bacterium]|nr:hypothetical protein [Acidimicrobiales bacterium]
IPAPGGLLLAGLLLLATAAAGPSPAAPVAPLAPVPAAIRRRRGLQPALRSADTAVACGWRGPPAPVPA